MYVLIHRQRRYTQRLPFGEGGLTQSGKTDEGLVVCFVHHPPQAVPLLPKEGVFVF